MLEFVLCNFCRADSMASITLRGGDIFGGGGRSFLVCICCGYTPAIFTPTNAGGSAECEMLLYPTRFSVDTCRWSDAYGGPGTEN